MLQRLLSGPLSELLAGLDLGAEGVEGGEQTCDSGC